MVRRLRVGRAAALMAVASIAVAAAFGIPAGADTAPPTPGTPLTVSADLLPAPQIDGVAWSQTVSGNRVYVTGSFSNARPYGAAPGTNLTPRSNILAYDLTTGALITSWAPTLNAQGLSIAASPDGTRVYVVGDFTQVNGVNRYRIAALDANTGAVLSSFTAGVNARVRALAVTSDTVYVGGIFTVANNVARTRLAAFATSNGALMPFNATAEQEVMALTAPPGSGKLIAGGRFTMLSGVANYGLGAVDATTGAALPWAANQVVRDAGVNAAIYSLANDGAHVYGSGYTYGSGGNLEGSFGADTTTGTVQWVNGCRGDTYSVAPIGPVLYSVGHPHDCGMIGAFPQSNPWTYQHAMGTTIGPAADGRVNTYGNFTGRPAPEMLHWLPTLDVGSYTGQSQAAWHVTGTSQYVLLGGEFPKVNGTAQQGLARFAVKELAPNRQGPIGYSRLTPTLTGVSRGTVKATWTAAWDRDNRRLTYELLRGATMSTSIVITTFTADSNWWTRPALSFTDTTAPPGTSQTYRVRVTDPFGNSMTSVTATVTVPT